MMLAGLSQKSFLSQWGEPEIQISLDRLEGFFSGQAIIVRVDSAEEFLHTVWIYEKQDRIFFFTRQRLTAHFKWSEFREQWKTYKEETRSRFIKKPSPFITATLALVA